MELEHDLLQKDILNIKNSYVQNKIHGIRRLCSCILKGVPEHTTVKEIEEFLFKEVSPDVKIKSIFMNYPNQPKVKKRIDASGSLQSYNIYCLQAFVKFQTDDDCKKVVGFFQPTTADNIGYPFTNKAGISSFLFVHFMYTKKGDDFYLRKMLHVKKEEDFKLEIKNSFIMLYRLPPKTTADDVTKFLQSFSVVKKVLNVTLRLTYLGNKRAVVKLGSQEMCNALIEIFDFYNESAVGYPFINSVGETSGVFASFYYARDDNEMQDNEMVLKNVPGLTGKKEIQQLLSKVLPQIKNCHIKISPLTNCLDTESAGLVYIWFENNSLRDNAINHFKDGVEFTNMSEQTSFLFAEHVVNTPYDFDIKRFWEKVKISKSEKNYQEITVYNLPKDTVEEEIELFFTMIHPDIIIENIQVKCFDKLAKAFVRFKNEKDCKEVYSYFEPFMEYGCGYEYESFSGLKSQILICYSKLVQPHKDIDGTVIENEVVLWNLPLKVTADELKDLLFEKIDIQLCEVSVMTKDKNSTAFIRLSDKFESKKLIEEMKRKPLECRGQRIFAGPYTKKRANIIISPREKMRELLQQGMNEKQEM